MRFNQTPYYSALVNRAAETVTEVWNRFFQDLVDRIRSIFPYQDTNPNKTVWDDLRFPPSRGMVNPVTAKPDFSTTNIGLLLDPSSEEPIYIVAQLPHGYKAGTNIKPHVHWQATSTNTSSFSMRMQYVWYNANEAMPAWSNVYSTHTPSGTAWVSQVSGLGELDGTNKKESSIVKMVVTRDATNASTDIYPNDILLDEMDIHYQIEKLGSGPEYP